MIPALEGLLGGQGFRRELPHGTYAVGRGTGSSLQLSDASVSREHAELEVGEGGVDVRDAGSRNGTWVNGYRLAPNERVSLRLGDVIRFGAVQLRLVGPESASHGSVHPADSSPSVQPAFSQSELHASVRMSWDEIRGRLGGAARRDRDLFQVLSEAGQLLVGEQPLEAIFGAALDLVERAVPARRILLLLLDPGAEEAGGDPVIRAARPERAAGQRIMLSRTLMDTVLKERAALLVADAQSDPRFKDQLSIVQQDVHSALAAPLFDNEKVIGLVYADTNDLLQRFDQDMLQVFTVLANLIAIKISNTRLLEAEREKERMENELRTAARIQQSLLPAELPAIPGYEIFAQLFSCYECAGDLYDAAELEPNTFAITLGDVSGKGMGAAMLMSHVMACLRLLHDEKLSPGVLVNRLHKQLFRASRPMDFVTMFYGRLDAAAHRLDFVNGGHCPPMLLDGEDVSELPPTGFPVAMLAAAEYAASTVDVPPGATLCIFSDGIPEARVGDDDYAEERLRESLKRHRGLPLAEVAAGILADLRAFLGNQKPEDDITLVLLRRSAS